VINLTEEELPNRRTELLEEIEQVRSQVKEKEEKIHMRAQEDIFGLLGEAFKAIEDGDTGRPLIEAASKISLARQRVAQAERQKRWLTIPIGAWMVLFIGVGAWAIYEGEFWPKATEVAGRDILFGAVLWGVVGAAIDGLRELHTRLARQELDPDRLAWYLVHPLIGAGLGGILFLLVSAGLLTTGKDVGDFNPSLPLILSALAGFEQQNVIRYLRDTIRRILRIEEASPNEGG
jgi:hypothetical protein